MQWKRSAVLAALVAGGVGLWLHGGVNAAPTKVDDKDVKTTAGGVKYTILKPGTGTPVVRNQQVWLHYTGWVQNQDKEFDTSRRPGGQPLQFIVGKKQILPGFDEGVLGMLPGERRQIVLPPDLALGAREVPMIPANSTLVFEIEMEAGGIFAPSDKPTKVDAKKLTKTKSGLKYAVLAEGTGPVAETGQDVEVHYTGWLQDGGKKFDSSIDRGRAFAFPLGAGRVIKGWDEGVAGMKVGEKRQLIVPGKLGYEQGTPDGAIPPNATLVFEVTLLRVMQ
jgi:peptidylprolyl isomerase